MKNNLNKAFSLAEIIVSMALVVMLSVVGFLACTVSVRMTDNRNQHISAWSVAYSAVDCLRVAVNQGGDVISQLDEDLVNLVGSNFVENLENTTGISKTTTENGTIYIYRTDKYTMNINVETSAEAGSSYSYTIDAYTDGGYKLVDIKGVV